MPSPKEPTPSYGWWWCNVCDEKLLAPKDDSFACMDRNCDYKDLCGGCVFECSTCKDDFCREHIIETPLANGQALYECIGCHIAASELVRKPVRSLRQREVA